MPVRAARKLPDARRVVIYRSTDRAGSTFELSSATRALLQQRFADKFHEAPRVFVAHETRDDWHRLQDSMKKQLLSLLTGLDEELVAQAGEIEFRDPVTDRVL